MLKNYLINIASSVRITDFPTVITGFYYEWKEVLEEGGFQIDEQGFIHDSPAVMLEYHKRILEEYIILRCLVSTLNRGELKPDAPEGCKSEWEFKNVTTDIHQQCTIILQAIAEKLNLSAGAA
jgi:hypothetical protein